MSLYVPLCMKTQPQPVNRVFSLSYRGQPRFARIIESSLTIFSGEIAMIDYIATLSVRRGILQFVMQFLVAM